MADVIGALRVVLGADTAALDSGLKSAESSVSRFAKNVTTIAAGIKLEAILTSAFNSIAHAIKKSVLAADDMGKMAEKVGIPVEKFSELAYAAKLADVPIDTLKSSLIFLSKQMAEAAGNPASKAARAFEAIGLSAIDARTKGLKPLDQMFTELVGKLGSFTEGAGTNALAVRFLGRAGAELAPLFRDGAEGIRAAAEEARKFGIVITQDMANSSKNFKDNMERLGAILDGMILQISGPLATALEQLSNQLVDAAKDGNLMEKTGRFIGEAMIWAAAQVEKFSASLSALSKIYDAVRNALNQPLGLGIQKALDEERAAFADIEARYNKARETFQQNVDSPWRGVVTDLKNMNIELGRSFANWQRNLPPIVDTGRAASGASKGLREAEKAARAAEAAIAKLMEEGKQIEEAMLPTQRYAAEVKKLNELLAVGAVSAEAYALKMSHIRFPSLTQAVIDAGDFNKQIDSFSVSSINTIADGLTNIVTGAKSAQEAFTEMARSILRDLINMIIKAMLFQYVVAPLLGLPTGGPAGAIGIGLPKFAKGGSFKVGGSGQVDSQLVAFRATPGERVDIRTPSQQRDMGGGPAHVDLRTRIVNAFDGPSFLSEALASPVGEKVMLNFVRANPGAFRAALS